MKRLIGFIFAMSIASATWAAGPITPKGDDYFPWPWGTECPFPWQEIEGVYVTRSLTPFKGSFSGHYMVFGVVSNKRGTKLLRVAQYDRQGWLYAKGHGFSQKDQRIVTAVLETDEGSFEYVVKVRSYLMAKDMSCSPENLVTAVSFCSPDDDDCSGGVTYLLEKVKQPN